MLRKTINSTNLDGHPITEDFYFNLTTAELTKLQLRMPGGMEKYLQEAIQSGDGGKLVDAFETMVKASYGRRTADGKFVKKDEYFDELVATEAYSQMFMELVTDSAKGAEFINGIMPADLMERANKLVAEQEAKGQDVPLAQWEKDLLSDPKPPVDEASDPSFNIPATIAMANDVTPALQEPQKPKHPKDMTKDELLMAMKIKNAKGRVLTEKDIVALDDATLTAMIEAGATVEGL